MRYKRLPQVSAWRRLAVGMWSKPENPTAQGNRELILDKALPFLESLSEEAGFRLTITHLYVAAVARTLKLYPEYNLILRRNRPYQRRDIEIFVQVATRAEDGQADLSGLKVIGAEDATLIEIAQQIRDKSREIRGGKDDNIEATKKALRFIPPFLAPHAMRLLSFVNYDLGWNLEALGVPRDGFGSAMVTNIGGFNLPHALVPLLPHSKVPFLFCLGKIHDRVHARDGEIVALPTLIMSASFDHRLYDGFQIGQICDHIEKVVTDPEAYDLR